DPSSAIHLPGGVAADPSAATTWLWRHDGGAGHHRLRVGGTKEALFARHRQSRRVVVPGLLRAGRRLGPRLVADASEAGWRLLHRQWAEDLDDPGAACRLDLLPRAHRPAGEEAGGDLVSADRYEDAGRHGASDHHDRGWA